MPMANGVALILRGRLYADCRSLRRIVCAPKTSPARQKFMYNIRARSLSMPLKRKPLTRKPSILAAKPLKSKTRKRRKKSELSKAKDRLWELCKLITRKRYVNPDGTWTCYTSGQTIVLAKNVHTGHFIPSSLCSVELRYDLRNLRPQSYNDNINHSGNPHTFRHNLIKDHGQEYVDELERRNEATKGQQYPLQWFLDKIAEYEQLLGDKKVVDDK